MYNLPLHGWSNAIRAFPTTVGDVLPDNLKKTHDFAGLAISQSRKALALFILSGFKCDAERKDLKAMCDGDGCALLNLLYARAAEVAPAEINTDDSTALPADRPCELRAASCEMRTAIWAARPRSPRRRSTPTT